MLNADQLDIRLRQTHIEIHAAVRAAIVVFAALFAEVAARGANTEAGLLAALQIRFKQVGEALCQPPPVFSAQLIQRLGKLRQGIIFQRLAALGCQAEIDRAPLIFARGLGNEALALQRLDGLRNRALGGAEKARERDGRIGKAVGPREIAQRLPLRRIQAALMLARPHQPGESFKRPGNA